MNGSKVPAARLLALLMAFASLTCGPLRADAPAGHEFDFEIGTWSMHVRKLDAPLAASPRWVTVDGLTHLVQPIWGGDAILAQLEVSRPAPQFLGSLLHLYDARGRRWRVFWVDRNDASIDPPFVGSFAGGRGTFDGPGSIAGKPARVRVIYDDITHASFRTEQSFSLDGGKTWTVEEVTTFTRRSS